MTKLEEKIKDLVKNTIKELGYSLYDVIYAKEGKENYLRIFIDNDAGISLDDCENVNNAITDMLDEADYIKEQYFLEISSPGIERVLRSNEHLEKSIGNEVYVKVFKPIDGKKEFEGILKKFTEDNIIINDTKEITLERKNIALIKQKYNW